MNNYLRNHKVGRPWARNAVLRNGQQLLQMSLLSTAYSPHPRDFCQLPCAATKSYSHVTHSTKFLQKMEISLKNNLLKSSLSRGSCGIIRLTVNRRADTLQNK